MAEKALPPQKKRVRFTYNPSAGSSAGGGGGGGGGGDSAAASGRSAPQREPASSSPRSPSPPEPFTYDPDADAGSRGDGGGGGGGGTAAAPPPAPRRKPSSPPPRSPPPLKPFTYNSGEGSSGGGGAAGAGQELSYSPPSLSPPSDDDEVGDDDDGISYSPPHSWDDDEDDGKVDKFQTRIGEGSLFMTDPQSISLFSSDPQKPPHLIGRQNCEPLAWQKFLSLRHNWRQLLDGKKTYLRPPKNNRVAKDNHDDSIFVAPKPLPVAVHSQEPLSLLVRGGAGKPIRQQQFKILSEHYVYFRPMRRDGSQFYRAFLFSYLENLGKMQGSQAEVSRLMECMARSRVNFRHLKWNNAYFSNPEAFFSSIVSEFEHLVNSVANGLNADELYKISLQEISSSRILSLLRLLTEVHIRTYEADYNRAVVSPNQNEKINALKLCKEAVRPFDADVSLLPMRALSQALGIPLHLATVDGVMIGGTVQVKCLDIIPQSGPLSSMRRYYISSSTDKQSFLPPGNLFLSDRMPLVTILVTPNATAILYLK